MYPRLTCAGLEGHGAERTETVIHDGCYGSTIRP